MIKSSKQFYNFKINLYVYRFFYEFSLPKKKKHFFVSLMVNQRKNL